MLWKREKPKKEIKRNTLTINTKNCGQLRFYVSPWNGKKKIYPWKRFYKWYFGRTSGVFVMHYTVGETMIKRDDVVGFNVHIHKKSVDV